MISELFSLAGKDKSVEDLTGFIVLCVILQDLFPSVVAWGVFVVRQSCDPWDLLIWPSSGSVEPSIQVSQGQR